MIKSNLATYMYRSQSLMAGQELKEGIGRQELIHLNSDSKNGGGAAQREHACVACRKLEVQSSVLTIGSLYI